MFSKILLSVDGSEHSARAAEKVGEIAESLGSEVLAFNVREMLPVRGGAYDVKLGEEEKDLAAEVASQLKAKASRQRRCVRRSSMASHRRSSSRPRRSSGLT
jgi:nucleotide-binding universal stress UspA family protein